MSSVLTFDCVCWGGNGPKQDRDRQDKTIRKAGSATGRQQETFDSFCHRRLTDRLKMILADHTHSLRPEFDSRLIDKSGRLRVPITEPTRFHQSPPPPPESPTGIQSGTWQALLYNHRQTLALTLPFCLINSRAYACTCQDVGVFVCAWGWGGGSDMF